MQNPGALHHPHRRKRDLIIEGKRVNRPEGRKEDNRCWRVDTEN